MRTRPETRVFAIIPVFNRLTLTLACIGNLLAQTHRPLQIIVVDGGSTDGTVETLRGRFADVIVLTSRRELWWTGAIALGIDHVLKTSSNDRDMVLMMNNDTIIPPDYVATMVAAAQRERAAVGAVIVDSTDPDCILDAGEFIDWDEYVFPVSTSLKPDTTFFDGVDVLPGRGSLVPVFMIRVAGNVDSRRFPHYIADYEFFHRLKRHGFRLGVCYGAILRAHINETGIIPSSGRLSFRQAWREHFSRRSMSNLIDHWRFITRCAPRERRSKLHRRLLIRAADVFLRRTPLEPIGRPFFNVCAFLLTIWSNGRDCLISIGNLPRFLRAVILLTIAPLPFSRLECMRLGIDPDALVEREAARPASVDGFFEFVTLFWTGYPDPARWRQLLRHTMLPTPDKIRRYMALRLLYRAATKASTPN